MNFYIRRNSILPTLKMKLIFDGRNDYKRFYDLLENSVVTFSMKNVNNGVYKVANKEGNIIKITNNDVDEYYVEYNWIVDDTNELGQFEGEFKINFLDDCSHILIPIKEKLYINVLSSFTKGDIEQNNNLIEGDGCLIYCENSPFTGGTVSGNTEFLSNIIVNGEIFSGNTNLNDIFLNINENIISGELVGSDLILERENGSTITISGFTSFIDIYTTGITLSGNTLIFNRNDNNNYSINLTPILSGSDIYVTGSTFDSNTKIAIFTRNNGDTFELDLSSLSGNSVTNLNLDCNTNELTLEQSNGDNYNLDLSCLKSEITGFTLNNQTINLKQNNANQNNFNINLSPLFTGLTDTYVTGFTYDNQNSFTINQNEGQSPLSVTMSGLSLNSFYSTSISGDTIFSGGTLLQTIIENIVSGNQITGTTGSVAFFGVGNTITEDNSNLFWDNTNKRLGILTNNPLNPFQIGSFPNLVISFNNLSGNAFYSRQDVANALGVFLENTLTTGINTASLFAARAGDSQIAIGTTSDAYNGAATNQYLGNQPLTGTIIQKNSTSSATTLRFVTTNTANAFINKFEWVSGTALSGTFTNGTAATPIMTLIGNGNLLLGTTIDDNTRLKVVGAGTTNSTFGLQVHNATGTNNALVVRDDGRVGIGTNTPTDIVTIKRDLLGTRTRLSIENLATYGSTINNGAGLKITTSNGVSAEMFVSGSLGGEFEAKRLNFLCSNNFSFVGGGGSNSAPNAIFRFYRNGIGGLNINVLPTSGTAATELLIANNNGDTSTQLSFAPYGALGFIRYWNYVGAQAMVFGYGSGTGTEIMRLVQATSNVLIGTTTDVPSSILTLESTTKGFLPPRNSDPTTNITSPVEGLMVFNSTTKKLQVYDGTNWVNLH